MTSHYIVYFSPFLARIVSTRNCNTLKLGDFCCCGQSPRMTREADDAPSWHLLSLVRECSARQQQHPNPITRLIVSNDYGCHKSISIRKIVEVFFSHFCFFFLTNFIHCPFDFLCLFLHCPLHFLCFLRNSSRWHQLSTTFGISICWKCHLDDEGGRKTIREKGGRGERVSVVWENCDAPFTGCPLMMPLSPCPWLSTITQPLFHLLITFFYAK